MVCFDFHFLPKAIEYDYNLFLNRKLGKKEKFRRWHTIFSEMRK